MKRVMPTRKKVPRTRKIATSVDASSLGIPEPSTPDLTAAPPDRLHAASYHWPLLLSDRASRDALLEWFQGIHDDRDMPWRKPWIDPAAFQGPRKELGTTLATRAYEIWVSEIMLQQTRVSTVIPYFNKWIAKWPTIQDLADAEPDDVLAAWKGLGYYSRATRLHQGAKDMVAQNEKNQRDCPIPSKAKELLEFSGIGPYTAGAISSIAFGEAEPVLDGNVARVLSRQLGLYADAKDKKTSDFLWKVADRLVKHVAPESKASAIPGSWNQAVMELGSTVCTPRPKCDECPIQATCRAYAEGEMLAGKSNAELVDIEDVCNLCDQLDTEDLVTVPEDDEAADEDMKTTKKRKREADKAKGTISISHYFTKSTAKAKESDASESNAKVETVAINITKKRKASSDTQVKRVTTYCSLFPKKIPKKKVAEEECVVCLVELRRKNGKSQWLIEQRPAKGLLASLWQFPQHTLPASKSSATSRKTSAQGFLSSLECGPIEMDTAKHLREVDTLDTDLEAGFEPAFTGPLRRKWVNADEMDNQTLSTGMRRCWGLLYNDILEMPTV